MTPEAPANTNLRYFATCAKGLEPAVALELRGENIRALNIKEGSSGVYFEGDLATGYRANLWIRSAVRVLLESAREHVVGPEELYGWARELDWSAWMDPKQTFSVESRVWDSELTHSKYAAMKVKDALCDYFRDKTGARPNVNVENAALPLFLYVYRDEAVLYRDLSGTTLHKRGYRDAMHKASLNECIAAGMILMSGWDGLSPLADPMCGSGTFLLEAALMALKRAPGLMRKQFPFEKWPDFEKNAWRDAKSRAHTQALYALPEGAALFGNDRHAGALSLAQKDAESSGLAEFIQFSAGDAEHFKPDAIISRVISNPPWGERIDDEDVKVPWIKMGDCLKRLQKTPTAEAWLLSGNPDGPKQLGCTKQSIPLRIGKVDARMVKVKLADYSQKI